MSDSGALPSLGRRVGARVEELVDQAGSEAAALAERTEAERRAILRTAFDEACGLFGGASAVANEASAERAGRLAELREAIATRSEILIAEADDPQLVRGQIESLLVALAETEAQLVREAVSAPGPAAPEALRADAVTELDDQPRLPEPGGAAEPETVDAMPELFAGPSAADEQAEPDPPDAEVLPDAGVLAEAPAANGSHAPFERWGRNRRAGQRLAVMRMAVGGKTRDEIALELDPALDADDREELLDDVFGRPGSRQLAEVNGAGVQGWSRPALR